MKTFSKIVALFVLAASPVIAQDVRTDYAHDAQFERYHSFCIAHVRASDQIVENRMRGAIADNLTKRGFQEAPAGKCDMTVAAVGAVHDRNEYTTFYNGFGPGWGWGGWRGGWGGGYGGGPTITSVDQIPVGTLVIDTFDSQTHALIFRGTARTDLSKKNQDKNDAKLYKSIDKIFDRFPGAKHHI